MPKHLLHRFALEADGRHYWIALYEEQMDAVLAGDRRVIETPPRGPSPADAGPAWWYFNDSASGVLRVEAGTSAEEARPVWEGQLLAMYVGRLCPVLLP